MTTAGAGPMVQRRDPLIERLVGETAEPHKVKAAATALGESVIGSLTASVAAMVPALVDIELEQIELGRIADVFAIENDIEPMTVAASANSPDALMISLDGDTVSLVTALAFGGGQVPGSARPARPISAIERVICGKLFHRIADALNGSGTRAMNVRFPLPEPIAGDERRRQSHRDGPSARMIFRMDTAIGSGRICVTLPQRVVLLQHDAGASKSSGNEWQARFSGEVMRSLVPLQATIPLGRMTLGDLAALQQGQVLEMPAAAPGETRLSSRDKTLFICEFGKLGQNYTVRVKHPFDPEADLMNGLLAG